MMIDIDGYRKAFIVLISNKLISFSDHILSITCYVKNSVNDKYTVNINT